METVWYTGVLKIQILSERLRFDGPMTMHDQSPACFVSRRAKCRPEGPICQVGEEVWKGEGRDKHSVGWRSLSQSRVPGRGGSGIGGELVQPLSEVKEIEGGVVQ
jgi:hypothetical protein